MGDPVVEAFQGGPYYEPLVPHMPPANNPFRCGEWWGCPDWMVKGEPRFSATDHVGTGPVPAAVSLAEEKAGEAVDARLGPAQWGVMNDEGITAYIPIGVAEGFAVNPDYLDYASAEAKVEAWRWLPTDDALNREGQPQTGAGVLVGVRDGEAVTVVCPLVWRPAA